MNRITSGRQMSSSRAEIEARFREDAAADMDAAGDAAAEQGEEFARNTITEIAAVVQFRGPQSRPRRPRRIGWPNLLQRCTGSISRQRLPISTVLPAWSSGLPRSKWGMPGPCRIARLPSRRCSLEP